MNTKEMVNKNLIYKCVHGSTAYGLNTPSSDLDVKGIFVPDIDYYFGYKTIEQQEDKTKDEVIYSIKKFFKLAMDCNPNIIEVLFCDEKDILYMNEFGKKIRDNRLLFLSKKAKFTFSGYAFAQLKRIKGHNKWINNPQTEPKREDYLIQKSMKAFDGRNIEYTKFLEVEYDKALKKYNQYLNWKKNRNPERAKLELKYGYDTKHGMHLVRLLRMGHEILKLGDVIVKRPDRKELLEIRNGLWKYDRLVGYAEDMQEELDELYEKSDLQKTPNNKEIGDLLMYITARFLRDNGEI